MINNGDGPSTGPIFPPDFVFDAARKSIDRDEALLNMVAKLIDKIEAMEKRLVKLEALDTLPKTG